METQICSKCSREATTYFCSFHNECDVCSTPAGHHFCDDHKNGGRDTYSSSCDNCGGDANYCTTCAECTECGSKATKCDEHAENDSEPTCASWGCTRTAEYIYCESHLESHDSEVIENYDSNREPDEREVACSFCGNESNNLVCRSHLTEALKAAEGTKVSTDTEKEIVRLYDEDGNGRNFPRQTLVEWAESQANLAPIVWPIERAGDPKRSIVNGEGFRTTAQNLSTLARFELGMVFSDERVSVPNVPAPAAISTDSLNTDDKALIAGLLQREQIRRFMVMRDAFNSTPSGEIGVIPENVKNALDDYTNITALMKRFDVDAIANNVLGQMVDVMAQRDAQLSN